MGSGSQHGFVAFAAATILACGIGSFKILPPYAIFCIMALLLGGIFPDVDVESSKIHRWLMWPKLYGHKWKHWGHAHSVLGDFLFSLPLLMLDILVCIATAQMWWMFAYFNIGCFLHCLLDDAVKGKGNKRHATKLW
jgi:uncharacterized metal-binding protein